MPEKKIPEGYIKCGSLDDKHDIYYNPNEKDSLKAYIKIEVK